MIGPIGDDDIGRLLQLARQYDAQVSAHPNTVEQDSTEQPHWQVAYPKQSEAPRHDPGVAHGTPTHDDPYLKADRGKVDGLTESRNNAQRPPRQDLAGLADGGQGVDDIDGEPLSAPETEGWCSHREYYATANQFTTDCAARFGYDPQGTQDRVMAAAARQRVAVASSDESFEDPGLYFDPTLAPEDDEVLAGLGGSWVIKSPDAEPTQTYAGNPYDEGEKVA